MRSLRKPKPTQPQADTRPGLEGQLEIFSRHLGKGRRLAHTGPARLLEAHDGLLLFLDLGTGREMWLAVDEVVRFTVGEAS